MTNLAGLRIGEMPLPDSVTSGPGLIDALVSADSFARLAKLRLANRRAMRTDRYAAAERPGSPSDFDLNPDAPRPSGFTPAAVLIPVMARSPLTVLLTRRSERLKHHAGQIAFPGGRIDPTDGSAVEAALREAFEEVGLQRSVVEPLGQLDIYRTGTGYEITPVVALIATEFAPILQDDEVAEVFEVPLAHLMDSANHKVHTGMWQGVERRTYSMPWGERYIWGATAGMLKNLHETLFAP